MAALSPVNGRSRSRATGAKSGSAGLARTPRPRLSARGLGPFGRSTVSSSPWSSGGTGRTWGDFGAGKHRRLVGVDGSFPLCLELGNELGITGRLCREDFQIVCRSRVAIAEAGNFLRLPAGNKACRVEKTMPQSHPQRRTGGHLRVSIQAHALHNADGGEVCSLVQSQRASTPQAELRAPNAV